MNLLSALKLLFYATLPTLVLAVVYDRFENLPATSYDFVVIGAGAAGSVVANRLTENPQFSVLLLESGGPTQDSLNSQVPLFTGILGNTALDWNFTTTPQTNANGLSMPYPRGHGLGGSTAINAMFYTRGSKDDFDRYAKLADDEGWSWENVQKYFHKNEKWTRPADGHDVRGQFNASLHSSDGINFVSLAGSPRPTDDMVIQTTKDLPDVFPFNLDMNSGKPLGLGWIQTTISSHGRRSSAATSYLADNFLARPNFDILVNARVTRVLPLAGSSKLNPLQFGSVEFSNGSNELHVVRAKKEIVLSAGTIMTPHILLHSGIGPASELSAVGITPILDLPSVGKNMTEQPLTENSFFVNSTETDETWQRNATLEASLLEEWKTTGQGLFTTTFCSHMHYSRIGTAEAVKAQFGLDEDPAAGEDTPHLELATCNSHGFPEAPTGNFITLLTLVVSSASRGSVSINSTNPFDPPLIDLNLFGTEFDLAAMRAAVRLGYKFFSGPAWSGYIIKPEFEFDVDDDAALDEFIRAHASSGSHPVGTASMSKKGSQFGVVNSDLRVKGTVGLRVVDASILPRVNSGHTQAPTYVVGEKGSDLIKQAW